MMEIFAAISGSIPLLVSIPHAGVLLPSTIEARLTDAGLEVPDTDWHVDRLYGFAEAMGASVIKANYSRYVIDLNRAPDGASLYPGQTTTGLCPKESFDGTPLYRPGSELDPGEVGERIATYWRPYHDWIIAELDRIKARHGIVLLWDAHSIRSEVPRLFEGRLPDLNFGTNHGASCMPGLGEALLAAAQETSYSSVLNGRFTGGYITRNYGRPAEGINAVQLEMVQSTYLKKHMAILDEQASKALSGCIRKFIETALSHVASKR